MQTPQQIKILLIDDHEIVLWALSSIIRDNIPEAEIFTALTFDQGLAYLQKHEINMAVLDIDVPGGNGPKMIDSLKKLQDSIRILIHTASSEEELSIKYLSAGADGFISKASAFTTIHEALVTVLRGERYISAKTQSFFAQNYLQSIINPPKPKKNIEITPREEQIIFLLLQGKWTKEIASDLGIKWSTVSTHKLSIFEKFGVTNILDLYKKVQKERPELLNKTV